MAKKHAGNALNIPLYQVVKQYILEIIESKNWDTSTRLPSENELVELLSVSRMTVNRALRELTSEGYIVRVVGVGSFIAEKKSQSDLMEIRNIADDISIRGHSHHSDIITLEETRATPETAILFGIAAGSRLFHSVILHSESDTPIQVEERYIHPAFAPHYMEEDFSKTTPTEYLLSINNSIDEIEHIIQAEMPSKKVSQLLKIPATEPCLVLQRRTWVGGQVVTKSTMHHPSSLFQLGSRYKP